MIPALVTLAVTAVVANAYPNAEPVVAIQRSWRRVLAGRAGAATVIQRIARGFHLRFQTRRVVNYRGDFLQHGPWYLSPFHLLDLRRFDNAMENASAMDLMNGMVPIFPRHMNWQAFIRPLWA